MEESAFIKCPSCLSEVEISRSTFFKLAGQAIRCPECASPIPLSGQTTWEELVAGHESPGNLADLQERMAADLHASVGSDEELEPEDLPEATPPSAGTPATPAAFSKAEKRLNKVVLFFIVALLLCGVGLWVFTRSSDLSRLPAAPAVEPSIVAATTTTTVPPPPPPPPAVLEAAEPTTEERAAVLFASYQESFLSGKIEAARTALRDLNSVFSSSVDRDAFWRKRLGAAKQRTLRVMVLCSACADEKGKCPQCKGNALCVTCKGQKVCALCKGNSVRKSLCPDCTCRACSASGLCKACQGTGRQNCRTCGATGRTEIAVRETCRACNGTGYRSGLRNAEGHASKLPCLPCHANGWIARTRSVPCVVCDGNGWVPCAVCNNTGVCTACEGRGHKVPCVTCGDTGWITAYCPRCQGTGKCVDCRGTGKCALCHGSGVCSICQGKGLTESFRLTVMSTWLIQDRGYVLIEPDETLKREAGASGHVAIEHGGRPLSFTLKPDDVVVIVQSDPATCRLVIRTP